MVFDQTTFLPPCISLKVVLLHPPPDTAGVHFTTSIKPHVSSAGVLQGSTSQPLHCNFLAVYLLKHFLQLPQLIPNTAACLLSNLPKFLHVSSVPCSLLWLPVAAHTTSKSQVLATHGCEVICSSVPPGHGRTYESISRILSWVATGCLAPIFPAPGRSSPHPLPKSCGGKSSCSSQINST